MQKQTEPFLVQRKNGMTIELRWDEPKTASLALSVGGEDYEGTVVIDTFDVPVEQALDAYHNPHRYSEQCAEAIR